MRIWRGAPHSAKPNAAGGGFAAFLPDRPAGGQARRAAASVQQGAPIACRRFAKVRIAAFRQAFCSVRH